LMTITMARYLVATLGYFFYQRRITFGTPTQNKKGCFDLMLVKNIEQYTGISAHS